MTPAEALDSLLKSYQRYYNIRTEDVEAPFTAEAIFHTHDEQYFLVKTAKLSEAESHEYVFFALGESLGLADVQRLEACAWERGTSHVKPSVYHRNTDVTLIILAEHIAPEALTYIKKSKRYQSYRFSIHGWSSYRAVALETSTGGLSYNRRGQELKKLFRNIQTSTRE